MLVPQSAPNCDEWDREHGNLCFSLCLQNFALAAVSYLVKYFFAQSIMGMKCSQFFTLRTDTGKPKELLLKSQRWPIVAGLILIWSLHTCKQMEGADGSHNAIFNMLWEDKNGIMAITCFYFLFINVPDPWALFLSPRPIYVHITYSWKPKVYHLLPASLQWVSTKRRLCYSVGSVVSQMCTKVRAHLIIHVWGNEYDTAMIFIVNFLQAHFNC